MRCRVLLILITMAAVGLSLLALRAERLSTEHEIALLHERIDAGRRAVWDTQVRVAGEVTPDALHQRLADSGTAYEAVIPEGDGINARRRYAAATDADDPVHDASP